MGAGMAKLIRCSSLALLILPFQLQAQTPRDTLATVLQEARQHRWMVRATVSSGAQHEGLVTLSADSTLAISGTRFHLSDVSVLERKRVNHGTTKAGAILGGLGGLALGIGLASWACSSDDDCAGSAFLAGGALTAGGAALGGIIGGTLGPPEWRLVWRRP